MTSPLTLSGVPRPILQDAWWMEGSSRPGDPAPPGGNAQDGTTGRAPRGMPLAVGLVGLVALADILFWDQFLGLSVALFLLAVFGVATADIRPRNRLWRPQAGLVLGLLPVVEYVQALSLLLGVVALAAALICARGLARDAGDLAARVAGLVLLLPFGALVALLRAMLGGARGAVRAPGAGRSRLRALWRDWAFPLAGLALLLLLLAQANPLLDRWLAALPDGLVLERRLFFWLGAAALIWPFLSPRSAAPLRLAAPGLRSLGPHPRAVARALVLFNAALGVQTVMDLTILIGGARLPEGMSYAAYAHRGAYPLIATAMLAGGFALLARPHLHLHPLLRPLMALWLGQNILLCLGAMLRLELYVDAYGLTYLRVWAAIWMVMVAAGLVLTGWQIWRGYSGGWLLRHTAVLGLGTLYLASFVNIAALIADYNLRDWRPEDGLDYPSLSYTMALPGTAHGIIWRHLGAETENIWSVYGPWALKSSPQIRGWRDWGFRNWRVARYIDQMQGEIRQGQP